MHSAKSNYEFLSRRKYFWMLSVVVIALGLITNILMGVRLDIRFTGGTMLRYSYPESGPVTAADIPAAAEPQITSDSQVVNTSPEPADVPVIISGSDISASDVMTGPVSGSDMPGGEGAGEISGPKLPSPEDIRTDYSTDVDPSEAARIISEAVGEEVSVQISTDALAPSEGENKRLTVTFDRHIEAGSDTDELIRQVMEVKYPNVALALRETSLVDPAVGGEFIVRCIAAVTLAVAFMMLYVGMRFRSIGGWTAAVSAIIAIVHDCLVAYFAFVMFRFPVSDQFIAVVLAIIGHSLNSTIVIFDRIRENRRLLGDSMPLAQLTDRSINESLGRTICTDLCVFIAVAVLAVVSAVYDLDSMLSFAVPMLFGVAAGCYSSLFISATVWVTWQEALEKHRSGKKTGARES